MSSVSIELSLPTATFSGDKITLGENKKATYAVGDFIYSTYNKGLGNGDCIKAYTVARINKKTITLQDIKGKKEHFNIDDPVKHRGGSYGWVERLAFVSFNTLEKYQKNRYAHSVLADLSLKIIGPENVSLESKLKALEEAVEQLKRINIL